MGLSGVVQLGAALCWYVCPQRNWSSPPECGQLKGRCCSPIADNCLYYHACDFGQLRLEQCPHFQRFDSGRLICDAEGFSECYRGDDGRPPPAEVEESGTTTEESVSRSSYPEDYQYAYSDQEQEEGEEEEEEEGRQRTVDSREEEFLQNMYTSYTKRRRLVQDQQG